MIQRTVCNEAAEVSSNNAVPGWASAVVKGLLDVLCDVLLNVEFAHGVLCCLRVSSVFCLLSCRVRDDLPTSMASCCMSSLMSADLI